MTQHEQEIVVLRQKVEQLLSQYDDDIDFTEQARNLWERAYAAAVTNGGKYAEYPSMVEEYAAETADRALLHWAALWWGR